MDRILLLLDYLAEYRQLKNVYTADATKKKKDLESKIDVFTYMIRKDIQDGKIKSN